MKRKREYLWPGLLVAAVALGAFLLLLRDSAEEARIRVAFERQALERLRRVATAEVALHEKRSRYGTAGDLVTAGLIDERWLAEDGTITSPRYRIDVLLPQGLSPGGFVELASATSGTPQPKLAQRHFAVVARPWGSERTGHRSFCIDETGQVFLSEGAADVQGSLAPPLPAYHLSQSSQLETRGRRWVVLEAPGSP